MRFNGEGFGHNYNHFVLDDPFSGELDFIEPVALTTRGTIYRHAKTGKFILKLDGGNSYIDIPEKHQEKIRTYLKNRKPFDDDLFKM